jgi:cell wall-associated NlpC family hydrolase
MLDQVNGQVQQILKQEEERQRAELEREAAESAAMLRGLEITDATQAQVVETSFYYLGVPYVWGGESPRGFDCSGLVKYVYAQHGVQLPHNAAMQFGLGAPVPKDQLQPGDLVFFGPGNPHHVGMYVGKGKFIEAPNFNEVVHVSTLVFDSDYAGARRYPLKPRTGPVRLT